LKRVSTNAAKSTQKSIKRPKEEPLSTKKIFRSVTQKKFEEIDN
jgi:hypothetical protein